jgi:hypothetical protein
MKRQTLLGVIVLLTFTWLVIGVHAQSGGQYDLTWNTIDNGGGTGESVTRPYTLNSTAGQPDAALWSGGEYTLAGGFWGSVPSAPLTYHIYLPLSIKKG